MPRVEIKIDTQALASLGEQLEAAGEAILDNLLEEAEEYIREEAPERTGRLKKDQNSVFSETRPTSTGFTGDLIVSAYREQTGARQAVLHLPSGTTKQISLAPQPQFNYAEAVARGRKAIVPRKARALLIPVDSPPSGQSYITDGSQIFIVRPRAESVKPNEYDVRALKRLEAVAEAIVEKTLARFGVL